MVDELRIKRRTTGTGGAPSSLYNAELAFNEIENVLYYGKGISSNNLATSIIPIAGDGAFITRSTSQTISGNKTFTGDIDLTAANVSISEAPLEDNSSRPATTEFVNNQGFLKGNQTITFQGDLIGSGTTLISLTLKSLLQVSGTATKVDYNSKGLITGTSALLASDIPTLTSDKISDFEDSVKSIRLSELSAPIADIDMSFWRFKRVGEPVDSGDVATKGYVDSTALGLDIKEPVRVKAQGNITTGGHQFIDGVQVLTGDRVLVADQVNKVQNGIYIVAFTTWTRAADNLNKGSYVLVEEGTTQRGTSWIINEEVTEVGTDEINFVLFSNPDRITAGSGLSLSGNTLNVNGTSNRISVVSDSIDISPSYVGQTSITTLGTITNGTWSATAISPVRGGTGIVSYSKGDIIYASNTNSLARFSGPGLKTSLLTMTGNTKEPLWVPLDNTGISGLGTVLLGEWRATTISLAFGGTNSDLSQVSDGTILKKHGDSIIAAIEGTDYLTDSSTISGGTY